VDCSISISSLVDDDDVVVPVNIDCPTSNIMIIASLLAAIVGHEVI